MELFKKNKKAGRIRKEDAPAGVNKERGPEPPVMEDMEFETTAFVKRVKRRAGDCGQAAAQSPVPSVPASRPYSRFLEKSGEFRIRQCVYVNREIQEKVADIVRTLGKNKVTIGAYIDRVLEEHLEAYRDEISARYTEQYLSRMRR